MPKIKVQSTNTRINNRYSEIQTTIKERTKDVGGGGRGDKGESIMGKRVWDQVCCREGISEFKEN